MMGPGSVIPSHPSAALGQAKRSEREHKEQSAHFIPFLDETRRKHRNVATDC